MNDAILEKALEQVLAGMKAAAMKGKRSMFMKPAPVAAVMVDDPAADPSKPPMTDEDDPLAGDPAAPDDESDPSDPSDDEIEALLAAKGR